MYFLYCLNFRYIISKAYNEGKKIDDIQEVLTDTIQL
jgi:hypothetical protein